MNAPSFGEKVQQNASYPDLPRNTHHPTQFAAAACQWITLQIVVVYSNPTPYEFSVGLIRISCSGVHMAHFRCAIVEPRAQRDWWTDETSGDSLDSTKGMPR